MFEKQQQLRKDAERTYLLDGEWALDTYLRFERLPSDLERLARRIPLPGSVVHNALSFSFKSEYRKAKSARGDLYRRFPATVDWVELAHERLLARFPYPRP